MTGGPYGTGSRFDIPTTRRIVNAIQNVNPMMLKPHIPGLNLEIPINIDGIETGLNPIETWTDSESYQHI